MFIKLAERCRDEGSKRDERREKREGELAGLSERERERDCRKVSVGLARGWVEG